MKVQETTFFENVLSARWVLAQSLYNGQGFTTMCSASDVYKTWQKLGKTRDREEWEMYPSTVNAYFNPPANEVCLAQCLLLNTLLTSL